MTEPGTFDNTTITQHIRPKHLLLEKFPRPVQVAALQAED